MNIQLSEIDPVIAEAIRVQKHSLEKSWRMTDLHRKLEAVRNRRQKEKVGQRSYAFMGVWLSVVLCAGIIALSSTTPGYLVVLALLFIFCACISAYLFNLPDLHFYNSYNLAYQVEFFGYIPTAVEASYLKLVSELTNTDATQELAARKLLDQANHLMADYHRLTKRFDINQSVLSESKDSLEAEYDTLIKRLQTVTDPETQMTLEQTKALYEQRMESIAVVSVERQRMKSRFDAIQQTFESVRAMLVRERSVQGISVNPSENIAHMTATLAQMRTQTVAVEKALEEVATLHIER